MRIPSNIFASKRVISAALLALGIGAMALIARPAMAQTTTNGQPPVGTIRLGVFIPTNSDVTSPVGKYFPAGGLDYTFQQDASSRAQIGVDYIERSSSGSDVRLIPVTVSDLFYTGPRAGGVRPYWGLGVGAYFVHVNVPNPNPNAVVGNANVTRVGGTDTEFGGFLEAGLEFPENIILDLRYHQINEVQHVNPAGFEATVGYRF